MDEYNPIKTVDGAPVKCPSGYEWGINDMSASDSGRTEDGKMHKNRTGQAVKLKISWNNIKTNEISVILKAFNPEYINVCYLDAMEGAFLTKEFYVGDRSAPAYNTALGVWSVSFNIIER